MDSIAFVDDLGPTCIWSQAMRRANRAQIRSAAVAQLVEHVIRNDGVGGSSPFSGTTSFKTIASQGDFEPALNEREIL